MCLNSDDTDTALLKERFLQAMEQNVYYEADFIRNEDQLVSQIGKNFIGPNSLKAECYLALAFFPELFHKEIKVKYRKISATMNARPDVWNIFKKKANRKYFLLINNNKGKHKGLNLDEISFNARVGWFGHEFAHMATYTQMSNWQTLVFTVKYLISNKFVRKAERYTNYLAIKRGLVFQIYQGEQYILLNSALADDYRKRTVYRSLTYREYICLWSMFKDWNYFKESSLR